MKSTKAFAAKIAATTAIGASALLGAAPASAAHQCDSPHATGHSAWATHVGNGKPVKPGKPGHASPHPLIPVANVNGTSMQRAVIALTGEPNQPTVGPPAADPAKVRDRCR